MTPVQKAFASMAAALMLAVPAITALAASTGDGKLVAISGKVRFGLCGAGPRINCIVDGDTIWLKGEKIRILDIDTPETHPARCAAEQRLGDAATRRLYTLIDGANLALKRDGHDRYGRTLALVYANGQSVSEVLLAEGLARPYRGGKRAGWC